MTFWNEKEPFPSIGIGHFIWPPENYSGPFAAGRFHKVLAFLEKEGVFLPEWLQKNRYCPWQTRESFYLDFETSKMQELRKLLFQNKLLQAKYMLQRLNDFAALLQNTDLITTEIERQNLLQKLWQIAQSKNGMYILIDYLNFKHEGTNTEERYNGYGWGLLQVLEKIPLNPKAEDFVLEAKYVLKRRVENALSSKEGEWISNWFSRLETYI